MRIRKILALDMRWAGVSLMLALALTVNAQSGQQSPQQQTPVISADAGSGEAVVSEKEARRKQARQLALDGKYSEAYALGKQALVSEPNDLRTLLIVSWSGLFMATSGMPVNNTELVGYAQKALQLIHEGTVPDPARPFLPKTKEQILGWLEYALGIFMLKAEPDQAIGYLTMAAQSEGFQKYDPQTYGLLAVAYEKAHYEELAADYRKRFKTPEQIATPEGRAMLARILPVVNRMIDAYARAVALSGDNPAYAKKKVEWTTLLTDFYKFRHNGSVAGLDELVAGVLSRPLGTAMDAPFPSQTKPAGTVAAAVKPESSPQATTPQSSQQAAAPQASPPPAATAQSPERNLSATPTSARADTPTVAARSSSPRPQPSPDQPPTTGPTRSPAPTPTPAPISSATVSRGPTPSPIAQSFGLDRMFFSTWSYYLATNTGSGSTASPVSGTIRFSDKGASFNQDLHIQSAQTNFNYKYNGTFSIQGNKLSLVYRDAQGVMKTEVYEFVFSPELKALRLTRDYGRVSTNWILFLKGTENVSRCTEQGRTVLTDAICQQVRKAG